MELVLRRSNPNVKGELASFPPKVLLSMSDELCLTSGEEVTMCNDGRVEQSSSTGVTTSVGILTDTEESFNTSDPFGSPSSFSSCSLSDFEETIDFGSSSESSGTSSKPWQGLFPVRLVLSKSSPYGIGELASFTSKGGEEVLMSKDGREVISLLVLLSDTEESFNTSARDLSNSPVSFSLCSLSDSRETFDLGCSSESFGVSLSVIEGCSRTVRSTFSSTSLWRSTSTELSMMSSSDSEGLTTVDSEDFSKLRFSKFCVSASSEEDAENLSEYEETHERKSSSAELPSPDEPGSGELLLSFTDEA